MLQFCLGMYDLFVTPWNGRVRNELLSEVENQLIITLILLMFSN